MGDKYLQLPSGLYPWSKTLRRPNLNDLLALKYATGLGMRSIHERLERYDQVVAAVKAREGTYEDLALDLSEDPEVMEAMRAIAWLARRGAGETISVEQAGAEFSPDQWRVVATADDNAEVATADPTTPATGSDPAAGNHPAAPPSSSKTSATTSEST